MNDKTAIHSSQPQNNSGGLYGRSEGRQDIKRTYIQGMKPRNSGDSPQESSAASGGRVSDITLQERPVAGILYSVSHDVCGELFPVYVGRNTIGSDPASDVYLSEETVSPNHAVLLVRAIVDEEGKRKVTMNITDYDSDFGTAVNGVKLGYDREPLKGNEIIQIGNSYFFIFIPLDPAVYGLGQVAAFAPTKRLVRNPAPFAAPSEIYMPVPNEPIYPSVVGEQDERTFYGRTYAKKEDHSSKKTIDNGR